MQCRSSLQFAVAVSLVWTLLYNFTFWHQSFEAMWLPDIRSVVFFASLLALVLTLHLTMLLIVPTRRGLQAAASVLFVVAALSEYFSGSYGTLMDSGMMRNVAQTDAAEVRGLISADMVMRILVLGVLPALLVWFVQIPRSRFLAELGRRALFIALAWMVTAATVYACSARYAVFLREHQDIRSFVAPAAAVVNSLRVTLETEKGHYTGPLVQAGGDARRIPSQESRPLLMFLVIGETARAANFELGGYRRDTNPQLEREEGVVYFKQASSCGTATATSVPCIFSPFGRKTFDLGQADRYANLLDTLASVGVEIEWRDNNAGCKGVCKRVPTVSYGDRKDVSLCPKAYCFDEVMLKDLPTRLAGITHDTAIVFHQIGSHGPAYAERYPRSFERFTPVCRSHEMHRCTPEEIVNAYDNTITYTDYVLAQQIDMLRNAASAIDSVLIYVSDHGESLGENGIYLHGMPYAVAPRWQTEIPMLIWTSEGFRRRNRLEENCLRVQTRLKVSHDNIYPTVLGIFGVRNSVYDGNLDLLAACRRRNARG